ncbi:MAG: OstA family protein [Hyphomonadaceae bacterium]|nr:OstA family protein [Hyphomonadaceae bacterium]
MARGAFILSAFALAGIAAFPAEATAQLSSNGGPISYSADNLEYTDSERRLVLTGDVDVVQGNARLRSDVLTIYFGAPPPGATVDPSAGPAAGDIERMIAEGEVYYVRPDQQARGNRAVYETAQDSVTFTGNVVVASQASVIRGDTLVMHISSGRTTLAPSADRGRVQGVFRPRNARQEGATSGQ